MADGIDTKQVTVRFTTTLATEFRVPETPLVRQSLLCIHERIAAEHDSISTPCPQGFAALTEVCDLPVYLDALASEPGASPNS